MQQGPDTNTVLRDELHTDLWDATYTYRTNTDLIRDGASNVVAQTVEYHTLFPWGGVQVSVLTIDTFL